MDFSDRNGVESPKVNPRGVAESVADFSTRGVYREESPATQDEAIASYKKCVELDPAHAAAYINLGTLYYNRHDYVLAERYYRKAIEVDLKYALAYFDLGNVLDETGRLADGIPPYQSAIPLAPTYADAHYNLALAFEKARQPRPALRHWRAYSTLEPPGPLALPPRTPIKQNLAPEQL